MSLRPERRRRLLTDDAPAVEGPVRLASPKGDAAAGTPRTYADAARAARGRGIATLVPVGRTAIGLTAAVGLLLVAGCVALHLGADALAPYVGMQAVTALRLDAPGSIGRWLASTMLSAAGATAVFLYSLRRHRLDDYYGRYRVWLWIAAAALGASVLESSGLAAFARAVCHLAASAVHLRGEVMWPVTVATVVTAAGLRLFFEVRKSTPAVAGLAGAAVAFLATTSAYHGWPVGFRPEVTPLVARGSWLTGYVLVVTTFLVYSRFVQLEVTGGNVKAAKRRRAKANSDDTAPAAETPPARKPALRLRTDLDPVDVSPAEETTQPRPQQVAPPAPANTSGQDTSQRHLSRADRRRMKREARMAS